ncbi:methyltransferase domain-containing protein [Nocardioides sp. NPDC087217]|uniref:methyltransferase domain-containing protein n=1 Tax=Nocardioides sp. NPDC087217 TaxID=3364335 RepID=UPI003812113D
MREGPLEITDLLWSDSGEPVVRAEAVALLRSRGQSRAARTVSLLPERDGLLDGDATDALGLRIHRELQRLGEELQLGRRVASVVRTLLPAGSAPLRVVDVGCGLGHVLRSIAARREFPEHVELVGVDLNATLVTEASRLATIEGLDCRFVSGDAFEPGVVVEDGARTVVVSSGLMHHLAPEDLDGFFAAQARLGVAAFVHWDIAPCLWSTVGAWIFHQARMREAVSRHDGVMSARRAHPAETLLAAAGRGAPDYAIEVREGSRWHPKALDVLRPLVGVRR